VFYVLRYLADDMNGEDDDREDDASEQKFKKKTNTTAYNMNVLRYIHLRSTDLVIYEDNEEDAGSENANRIQRQRRLMLLNNDNELHRRRKKMTKTMTMKSKDRDGEEDGELDDVMTLPHSNFLCTSEEVNKRLCDSKFYTT